MLHVAYGQNQVYVYFILKLVKILVQMLIKRKKCSKLDESMKLGTKMHLGVKN